MKLLYPTRIIMIACCIFTMFVSCNKPDNDNNNNCPDPHSLTITQNGPVSPGWPLYLEADIRSSGYLYKWSGPNGWKVDYQIASSQAYSQQRLNITMADAGEYKLQLIDPDGCVAYQGSTTVAVLSSPAPPCTVTANTSRSSVAGVGAYNFIHRYFSGGGGHYNISGSETMPGGDHMEINFQGDNPPLPGVYNTSGFWALAPDQVGLYIETGTYQFVANPGQVFVNKVNNKLEITFCSLKFNNPLSPANPITISAKITQP